VRSKPRFFRLYFFDFLRLLRDLVVQVKGFSLIYAWPGIILLLSACSPTPTVSPIPTPLSLRTFIPYRTSTPTPTLAAPTRLPPPTETPLPTPTPFTYTVKKDDSMLAIAINYGISLEQLLAANPSVQPRMLSVGTVLVIPLEGVLATPEPTEAPLPLQASQPLCYPQADGGLWCLMLVLNDQAGAVENLTGRISFFSPSGESLGSQTVFAPLDLLQSSEKLALAAYFPPPLAGEWIVQGELLSALPVADGDPRYLSAAFQLDSLTIAPDGKSAGVFGVVLLPEGQPSVGTLMLAGTAYDVYGRPVSVRKWQVENPCPSGEICSRIPFEGVLYSLGPAIVQVELLVQAKP
jgi:LysM repeat protein